MAMWTPEYVAVSTYVSLGGSVDEVGLVFPRAGACASPNVTHEGWSAETSLCLGYGREGHALVNREIELSVSETLARPLGPFAVGFHVVECEKFDLLLGAVPGMEGPLTTFRHQRQIGLGPSVGVWDDRIRFAPSALFAVETSPWYVGGYTEMYLRVDLVRLR